MNTDVSVIVNKCVWDRRAQSWRTYTETQSGPDGTKVEQDILRAKYPTLDEAMRVGETKKAKGIAVIVRPNYNEKDDQGRYFREWRSFDGEPLKEVRWDI